MEGYRKDTKMAYTKTEWANGATALSAENMNHIETGIKDAHDTLANVYSKSEVYRKDEVYSKQETDSYVAFAKADFISLSNKLSSFNVFGGRYGKFAFVHLQLNPSIPNSFDANEKLIKLPFKLVKSSMYSSRFMLHKKVTNDVKSQETTLFGLGNYESEGGNAVITAGEAFSTPPSPSAGHSSSDTIYISFVCLCEDVE